jgi:hypothetical protein
VNGKFSLPLERLAGEKQEGFSATRNEADWENHVLVAIAYGGSNYQRLLKKPTQKQSHRH